MFLFWLYSVKAQNNSCFTISGTSPCNEWEGYQVVNSTAFSDPASFDRFIVSKFDNNSDYISAFGSAYGCDGYKGVGQRYHISIYCAMMVAGSSSRCKSAKEGKLCKDTCNSALLSLTTLFKNNTICPSPKTEQDNNRNTTLRTYTTFCDTLPTSNCIDGNKNPLDGPTCGFFHLPVAQAYCQVNGQDNCCKSLGGNSSAGEGVSGSGKTAVIVGIVIGCVLLVACGVFAYLTYKKKHHGTESRTSNMYDSKSIRSSAVPALDNNFVKVVATYVPNLDDELTLNIGDTILVYDTFDDGWSTGKNMSTKQEGTFPLACTVPTSDVSDEVLSSLPTSIKNRVSSVMR